MDGPNPEVRDGPSMNARRDRQLRRAGEPPEPGLPVLALGAGALGGQDDQERLAALRLAHQLADDAAGVLAVERDAAEPGQQPAERAAEELLLDEHPRGDVAAPHDEQHHHEVPVGRVRCADEHPACGAPRRRRSSGWPRARTWRAGSSSMFLSRNRRGGGVLRHHGTGVPGAVRQEEDGAGRPAPAPGRAGREGSAMTERPERPPRLPPRWFIRLFWQLHRGLYPRHRRPARPVAPEAEAVGHPAADHHRAAHRAAARTSSSATSRTGRTSSPWR